MRKLLTGMVVLCLTNTSFSQENTGASITGNVEAIFQYLNEDTLINALQPAQKGLLNSYMNVFYTHGNFKAGMRLESYLPRIQGYPTNFDGTGLGMRYIGYANNFVDITLGSFYEQFGNGLAFRSYEDRALGFDNMMDGARLILRPLKGVTVKGVYGYQREAFLEGRIKHGDGIVRGVDGELSFNQAFKGLESAKLNVIVGASLVSKYQKDDIDSINLPQNVGAYGGRLKLRYARFSFEGEYIYKGQDPSVDQYNAYTKMIYNPGHAAVMYLAYSQKGLGIMLSAKSVDNMSYRSDRNQVQQNLLINYLPSMNKVHTYNLVSSLYPWATQPLGEVAFQGEVLYTIPKGTKLGGKYGTSINVNFSTAFAPHRKQRVYDTPDSTGVLYDVKPFDMSDSLYWRDFNVEIYRKFNKALNVKLAYFNISMNNDVNKLASFGYGIIQSHIGVVELGYKINKNHALRIELQGLLIGKVTKHLTTIEGSDTLHVDERVWNDKGNWATVLLEYTFSPHWFFSVMDQYNMKSKTESVYSLSGNKTGVHYYYVSFGYIRESTRISVGYGRQREGLFCVGGICRTVPSSNGLTLSFTHSF